MAFLWIDRDRAVREPYEYKSLQRSLKVPSAKAVEGVDLDRALHTPTQILDDESGKRENAHAHEIYQKAALNKERAQVHFAEEIMTSPVKTLLSDTSVEDAMRHIQENRFRHIPVINTEGVLLGIISDRDLFKHYYQVKERATPLVETISNLIKTRVLTASPDTHLREIAKILFEERIGAMPILNAKDELVGIITRSDILRALVNKGPLEIWV